MQEWLTQKDLAEKAGITQSTLKNYLYRNLNTLPKPDTYFGRTPVWKLETAEAWVQSRRRLPQKQDN